jgi:hypothetical protein
MINLIKWDLINVWNKAKYLLAFITALIIVTVVFPQDFIVEFLPRFEFINFILPFITSVFFVIFFITCMIYIIFKMVTETRKKTYSLEITVDKKPWEIVLSKIIVNVLLFALLILVASIFEFLMERFSEDNTNFFNFYASGDFLSTSIGIVFSGINLYFAYVLSRSIKFTRPNAIFWTIAFIIVFGFCFNQMDKGVEKLLGYASFDTYIFETITLVREGILIILFYFGSCKLLEKKFDV